MKKIMNFIIMLLVCFTSTVYADSGLDASYDSNGASEIVGSLGSLASPVLKLFSNNPGDVDYKSSHIIVAVISIIIFYIFTCILVFKIFKNKKAIIKLGISLIPTILFSILCLFTKLYLFIYLFISIIYMIISLITGSIIVKKRLKKEIEEAKKIDKKFDIDKINEDTFKLYKDIQNAWMNFELDKVKDVMSKEIYDKYSEQLDKLKKENKKNIMDQIEFKSNKITSIKIDNNIEAIECNMNVTCIDYIVNNEDNLLKGKRDKKNNYTYKLVFNRNIKTNKYVLIEKKMKKQK